MVLSREAFMTFNSTVTYSRFRWSYFIEIEKKNLSPDNVCFTKLRFNSGRRCTFSLPNLSNRDKKNPFKETTDAEISRETD